MVTSYKNARAQTRFKTVFKKINKQYIRKRKKKTTDISVYVYEI